MTLSITTPTKSRPTLAVDGGAPIRDPARAWPRWPAPAPGAAENLAAVLAGDRWSLTGPIGTGELFERQFGRLFADYVEVRHCVPVDHGSSALVVALEALNLEYGDRVLVPALTWTASASAALRAGLVPVLMDVDPLTGCLGPDQLDLGVDARAIVAVHWSCSMADVAGLISAAEPAGAVVLEDCAQAHGARWEGRSAGSIGRLGCFSMQQGKVLTCGEGGAVVTDDDELAAAVQELRADSRRYRTDRGRPGEQDLLETAGTMGANFCLSEFNAAVLCAQLDVLDAQHAQRADNHALLTTLLTDIPGVRLHQPAASQTAVSIYEAPLVFEKLPGGRRIEEIARALTAELGRVIYLTDEPLHRTPLLQPWLKAALAPLTEQFVALHSNREYPAATFFYERSAVLHHSALLGSEQDMHDIANAVRKVVQAWS